MESNELSKRIQSLKRSGASEKQIKALLVQLEEIKKLEKKRKALERKEKRLKKS